MRQVGLRIDVDTFRGTRDGVPTLLRILARQGIRSTFFFSVGPDNMGRHLWRLLKPRFLWKMLRSNAASLYGWEILLSGTAWPGRVIGQHLGSVMREADSEQHEIGLHAWDHHGWQANAHRWRDTELLRQLRLGVDSLSTILQRPIDCSAAPGWRADAHITALKESLGFRYHSDCRGQGIFRPPGADGQPGTAQIAVDLPTFDEVVGTETSVEKFNDFLLQRLAESTSQTEQVYTIHAEVEGIVMAAQFEQLLERAREQGIHFVPLGQLLPSDPSHIGTGQLIRGQIPGREGWVGCKKAETI